MSLRTVLSSRSLVLGLALAGTVMVSGIAQAQPAPIPIPIPPGTTIPGLPPTVPTTIPGLPPIPPPGGTFAIPSVPGLPGLPGFKLFSPTGSLLKEFIKDEAKKIFQKEKDALVPARKSLIDTIPLQTDDNVEEVNAFAGCDDSGKTYVVVTMGLYQMVDLIAQARATDETFGTSYYDEYIKEVARQQEGKAKVLPILTLDPTKALDSRKLKRQRQIFDEAVSYIVGHELAHHYMGHLGSVCSGGGGGVMKPADVVNAAKKILPAINQVN